MTNKNLIEAVLALFSFKTKEQFTKSNRKEGRVYLVSLLAWLGLIDALIFFGAALGSALAGESLWVILACCAMATVGVVLILAWLNCRIRYDEDGFVAKNILGIPRHFTYDEVTAIRYGSHETYLYMGKRRVMVDEFAVGGLEFIAFVNKKHRIKNGGRPVPEKFPKCDIFKGNIEDGGALLVVYALLMAVLVGFTVFVAFYVFPHTTEANSPVHQTVVLVGAEQREEYLELTATDGTRYRLKFWNVSRYDTAPVLAVCDGVTAVEIFGKQYYTGEDEPYIDMYTLRRDGKDIFSFAERDALHSASYWQLLVFLGVMDLIWLSYCLLSIYVGRHIERFSPRVVKCFFKEENIR